MSNAILLVENSAVLVNDGYKCFILVVCKGDTKGKYDHRYWKLVWTYSVDFGIGYRKTKAVNSIYDKKFVGMDCVL